jgi:excisionase family DNA binding protein
VEPVTSTEPRERLAYSVDEAAAITGLSRDLLYDQMRAGKLAYLKVGRRRIITRQHLEAFLTRTALPSAWRQRGADRRRVQADRGSGATNEPR